MSYVHIGLDELGWKRLCNIVSFLEEQCGRRLSQSTIVRRMIHHYFQWLHMLDDPQLQLEELRLLEQVEKPPRPPKVTPSTPKVTKKVTKKVTEAEKAEAREARRAELKAILEECKRDRQKRAKKRNFDDFSGASELSAPSWER